MGVLGVLLIQRYDSERDKPLQRKRSEKRIYAGKPPLIDLHICGRDVFYPVFFFGLLFIHIQITKLWSIDDLVGRWHIEGSAAYTAVVGKGGGISCETAEGLKQFGWLQVSGNVFDGFCLSIHPQPGWKGKSCSAWAPYVTTNQRFRLEDNHLFFPNLSVKGWQRTK